MSASSFADKFIAQIDTALRTLMPPEQRISERLTPGNDLYEAKNLSLQDKKHVAGLMRVNHAGEVCAQALYQGQALTARLDHIKQQMAQAATEEEDHLAWCEQRLQELDSHPSRLNMIWYVGSLCIGALAGAAGDRWSLGFVAETEHQVGEHIRKHLHAIPESDLKTREILQQMQEDEAHHADMAKEAGAAELPAPVRKLMSLVSAIMTKTAYRI